MSPLAWSAAILLLTSLSLYVLFGGADFGGGILATTLPPHLRAKLRNTMAPVWEANHVWVIAVVVILFVGFPKAYARAMVRLYVPISLALLAILVRGVFFTLRKYDPNPGVWKGTYNWLFRASSLGAPLTFGFVLGALLTIHPGTPDEIPAGVSFSEAFVAPWLHPFGLLCGLFIAGLFGYLAAVFFFGEVETEADRELVAKRARAFFMSTFFLGGAVLLMGTWSDRVPIERAFNPVFLLCQVVAGLGILPVFHSLEHGHPWRARLVSGGQVLAILLGAVSAQFPTVLRTEGGNLELWSTVAPEVTLFWLVVGFAGVLALVVPLLVLLYRVFDDTTGAN